MKLKNINSFFIIDFIRELIIKYQKDNVSGIGAQLSYYLILSIFPFLIFLLNVLSFTPVADMELLHSVTNVLPKEVQSIMVHIIDETIKNSSQTLLSIGAITGIWTASRGVLALIDAINKAYDVEENRSFIELRILSIFFTIILVFLIAFVLVSMVFGQVIGKRLFMHLGLEHTFLTFWYHFRIVLALGAMIITFALFYKFSPSIRNKSNINIRFIDSLPGAIFTSLGWVITSIAFSFYVNNFGNYSNTYGSLGAIMIMLIWLYMSSIIIVLGGQINAVLNDMK